MSGILELVCLHVMDVNFNKIAHTLEATNKTSHLWKLF